MSNTQNVKFVIAEDDKVFQELAKIILNSISGSSVVGFGTTVSDVVALCRTHRPDFLILDWFLEDGNGLDVLVPAREEHPALRTFLLTEYPDEAIQEELLSLGVCAFLSKESGVEKILSAFRQAMSGGIYFDYSGRSKASPLKTRAPASVKSPSVSSLPDVSLTKREQEVAALVAEGFSSKEIASKLYLSTRTIEKHRANIYNKINVNDAVSFSRWWFQLQHKSGSEA
ncbi:MAG: response regulator transcription factor [Opitutales bacterium]|nr:response regulator transcription factor [Opitutales bacterium]MCH8539437.1 response regulator transcription factor [Opitutales bacterium]